jgi:signal transduction histidine kinase
MWVVLQWRIVGPLQYMAAHAMRVGHHDDLKARLKLARADEIGTLAREFDQMVECLAESRKRVLDMAHRAGMAEIASEVLHNVGNAVNSANCSVEVLDERLRGSKISGLDRAVTLLHEQAPRAVEFFGQDPRGPKLIDYLVNLNDTLQQERSGNQAEVVRLQETVRHIRDAIAAQQMFAGRSDFRQEVDLSTLVEDVLRLSLEQLRVAEIQVDVDLPPLPELQLNKSKITQVLVNLVRNAIQSMQDQPSDNRRLTIAASAIEEDGIEIVVGDTGMGFGEDVRAKLFMHGFTTKPEGNGFGLHYCANAVREADGNITAQSSGPGQGALFRIRLPHVMPAALATT